MLIKYLKKLVENLETNKQEFQTGQRTYKVTVLKDDVGEKRAELYLDEEQMNAILDRLEPLSPEVYILRLVDIEDIQNAKEEDIHSLCYMFDKGGRYYLPIKQDW